MLQLDAVTVRYNAGDAPAIDDLTLSIESGQRVALIGPSGAGKSTVLALAAGLVLPTSGLVSVFDVDSTVLGRRAHRVARARLGIISQDFALVGPLRVANNVAAGRVGRWTSLRALTAMVRPGPIDEIAEVLNRVGIAEKIWERTDRLSGGQQQRTAIARVLFQTPDLILADEPVSALDPGRSEAVIDELLANVTPDRALVASMHDAPLALRSFDRIVALRKGRLQFDLPVAEVTPALLAELYSLDGTA